MLHPSSKKVKKNKKIYKYIKYILTYAEPGCIIGFGGKEGGEKMSLQDKMIQYRAKERITQAELAQRCGISVQTICSVENGSQSPSKMTQAKIELVVGKELNESINK